MGASARKLWLADREKAVEEMKLLGDEAEAVDKRESSEDNEGRKVDCLGWEFNLGEWVVDVAEENRMKALYLFWTTDLEGAVALETMEALASMAQRYSVVYRELSVMMGELYSMQGGKGRQGRGGKRSFPESAKVVIKMWRAYMVTSEIRKKKGELRGRDLDSFRERKASWLVEFDGALRGVRVRLYRVDPEGVVGEVVFACGIGLTTDFKCGFGGNSSYQNAMELLAFTVGLGAVVKLGGEGSKVRLRGDSTTVLSWAGGGYVQL